MFHRPLQLNSTPILSNIWHAPLAGCSDYPFRKICARFKPGMQFCEMVKMEPLVRGDPTTFRFLHFDETMHPIGAQICGTSPALAATSARILTDLGFDLIDLNCGCPVDKVTKDGSGSALLKNIDRIGEILSALSSATHLPITLKARAGWDEEHIVVEELVAIAEAAGAKVITIHGRTREQHYQGLANREWIHRAKKAARSILVFGNGDLFSKENALSLFEETECDGVLLARGTLGKPWFSEEVRSYLESTESTFPTSQEEILSIFLEHLSLTLSYEHESIAHLSGRRLAAWYSKQLPHLASVRSDLCRASNLKEMISLIRSIPLNGPS